MARWWAAALTFCGRRPGNRRRGVSKTLRRVSASILCLRPNMTIGARAGSIPITAGRFFVIEPAAIAPQSVQSDA